MSSVTAYPLAWPVAWPQALVAYGRPYVPRETRRGAGAPQKSLLVSLLPAGGCCERGAPAPLASGLPAGNGNHQEKSMNFSERIRADSMGGGARPLDGRNTLEEVPAVARAIRELENAIAETHCIAEALRERLAPVLTPKVHEQNEKPAPLQPPQGRVSARLEEQRLGIYAVGVVLNEILQALEV